ncbi:MAG: hypothetical protein QNJ12_10715 [Ilumatobacter sp.]|nr:hypothetical protein [Ilumatobacter sp.]MDJ0769260.1 hypothetical protein [Ilumatobacter sp.]
MGQRDSVDRGVELSVASAAEPVTVAIAGPDRCRSGAVVAGERVLGLEAFDAGDFADELGRCERSDPMDLAQARRRRLRPLLELDSQTVDIDGELADALDEIGGDASDHGVDVRQTLGGDGEVLERGERAQVRLPRRVDLMQVPAEPVDVPRALGYQVFSVIDEQTEFSGFFVEMGGRQVGFT